MEQLRRQLTQAGSNTEEGRRIASELEDASANARRALAGEARTEAGRARAAETAEIVRREARELEEFEFQRAEAEANAPRARRGGGTRRESPFGRGAIDTGRLGTSAGFVGGGDAALLEERMLGADAGGEAGFGEMIGGLAGGIGENAIDGTNDMRDALAGVADEMERARDAGAEFGTLLGESAVLALEGEQTFTKAFAGMAATRLKALGVEEIAKGTGHVLEGVAASIMLSPQGPALIAVGAKEIALGAALAGGGVALGSAGGGGGGGRGGGERARPERPRSRGSDDGGGGAVNVIMQGSTITATTEAELGRRIERMVRAGQRRHGAAA